MDKILDYQQKIIEQTGESPRYYIIDNKKDLRKLKDIAASISSKEYRKLMMGIHGHTTDLTMLCGSEIIIHLKESERNGQGFI